MGDTVTRPAEKLVQELQCLCWKMKTSEENARKGKKRKLFVFAIVFVQMYLYKCICGDVYVGARQQ